MNTELNLVSDCTYICVETERSSVLAPFFLPKGPRTPLTLNFIRVHLWPTLFPSSSVERDHLDPLRGYTYLRHVDGHPNELNQNAADIRPMGRHLTQDWKPFEIIPPDICVSPDPPGRLRAAGSRLGNAEHPRFGTRLHDHPRRHERGGQLFHEVLPPIQDCSGRA